MSKDFKIIIKNTLNEIYQGENIWNEIITFGMCNENDSLAKRKRYFTLMTLVPSNQFRYSKSIQITITNIKYQTIKYQK